MHCVRISGIQICEPRNSQMWMKWSTATTPLSRPFLTNTHLRKLSLSLTGSEFPGLTVRSRFNSQVKAIIRARRKAERIWRKSKSAIDLNVFLRRRKTMQHSSWIKPVVNITLVNKTALTEGSYSKLLRPCCVMLKMFLSPRATLTSLPMTLATSLPRRLRR